MIKKLLSSLYIAPKQSHKGQNGMLMVIGGSTQYHGAPIFALLAARRFVDMLYFYPAEKDPYLIHAAKQIPEVIVDYNLVHMPDADAVLFGNGLGDASAPLDDLIIKSKKLIIDGDGLKLITNFIPPDSLLTPHEHEFNLLFDCEGTANNVKNMAKKHKCVILKKDPNGDIITDGTRIATNNMHNQGMTKGGTGDVLAGLAAALACKNDLFTSAACAAYINGYAGELLRKKLGYNFSASDLASHLAEAYFKLKKT